VWAEAPIHNSNHWAATWGPESASSTTCGKTPRTASALNPSHGLLILVQGDIPRQEGLRILPAAPALGRESGAEGLRRFRERVDGDNCVYSVREHATAVGYSKAAAAASPSQLSCYFEVSCRRHRCLPERRRRPFLADLGHRGILGMLLPLYTISFAGGDSNVAFARRNVGEETRLSAIKRRPSVCFILGHIDIAITQPPTGAGGMVPLSWISTSWHFDASKFAKRKVWWKMCCGAYPSDTATLWQICQNKPNVCG